MSPQPPLQCRALHDGEFPRSTALVRNLIDTQFPQWTSLPVREVAADGTDHIIFRLGDKMAARLPRLESAADQAARQHHWLPRLAPHLPLAIPEPVALGEPSASFPWPWSVVRWIEGRAAYPEELEDSEEAAQLLGDFVRAMRHIDARQGPVPGLQNAYRGVPLADRDAEVREALVMLQGSVDTTPLAEHWQKSLRAPLWHGDPAWIHGDLLPGNLLLQEGQLRAVIDFGLMGVGDPACDLLPAWVIFSDAARHRFREAAEVDDATWERGRGWALSFAVIALPYYQPKGHPLAAVASRTLRQVLSAHDGGSS